jgi:arylsulfatase A-like enzyme
VILWDPDRIESNTRIDQLISTLDIIPTVLEWADIVPPDDFPGRSLWPLLEGRPVAWRDALYGAAYAFEASDGETPKPEEDVYALYARTNRWKYVLYLRDIENSFQARRLGISTFRSPNWELQARLGEIDEEYPRLFFQSDFSPRHAGQEQLFDLENDPFEMHDLAEIDSYRPVIRAFRIKTLHWWEETGGGNLPGLNSMDNGTITSLSFSTD